MRKQEISKTAVVEDSIKHFRNGLYCSEAILKAFNDHYHMGLSADVLKVATGFGAGFGGAKCSCGALTGGILVLSLAAGRIHPEESEQDVFEAVAHLHQEFKSCFKATCCRVLTRQIEWGSPEHHQHCERFVKQAAETTADILSVLENKTAEKAS